MASTRAVNTGRGAVNRGLAVLARAKDVRAETRNATVEISGRHTPQTEGLARSICIDV